MHISAQPVTGNGLVWRGRQDTPAPAWPGTCESAANVSVNAGRRPILAFERGSGIEWFERSFQDCEADEKRRLGIDADQPHKIKYKRFARA